MKQKHFLQTAAALLGCALLLAGCKAEDTAQSGTQAEAEPNGSANVSAKPLHMTGRSQIVAAGDGIYEAQIVFEDSVSLFYTDVQTNDRIFLCADPNCSHQDASCTSYLPAPGMSFPPVILAVKDRICVMFNEPTENGAPHMVTMGLDGSDHRELFSLEANQYVNSRFATDGEQLYFSITETETSGQNRYWLCSADIDTGELRQLAELGNDAHHHSLHGCAGRKLCFTTTTENGLEYNTCTPEDIRFDDLLYCDSSLSGSTMVTDGYLFADDANAQTVTRYDLESGESITRSYTLQGSNDPAVYSRYAFDGNIILEGMDRSGEQQYYCYLLNFEDGTQTELSLRNGYDHQPISILAEWEDQLYVGVDYDTYMPKRITGDGVNSNYEYVATTYALISKQDFLNSRAEGYRMVQDAWQ